MRKIRKLIGLPVVYRQKKLGRLAQADLSHDLRRLKGIWVDCGLKGTRYISAEQLSMIGEVAIQADDRGIRKKCGAEFLLRRAVSTDGQRIGAAVGAEIDEMSFLITALEITRGFWDDLYEGRRRVETYSVHPEKGDVIIGNPAAIEKEEEI